MTGWAMFGLRHKVKQVAEVALDVSGAAALARRRMFGRDLVLAYHNVVADHEVRSDASGHLGVSNFTAQMRAVSELADVVPVEALASPAVDPSRPRVAITFDDGYASAVRHAVPVLTALHLPATFFVCPDLMGGEPFWWDCPSLDVWARRPELLERLQGRGERVWERLCADGYSIEAMDATMRPAAFELLHEAASRPGISVGSHTMSHPNLASIDERDVRRELAASHAWIAERFSSFIPWVAYPFGLANEIVERVARETGYVGGFVLDGGWIPAGGVSRMVLPRLNVAAGLSERGFRLRLADIFAR